MLRFFIAAALFAAFAVAVGSGRYAETVHLYLKINGSKTAKFNPEVPSGKIMVIAVSHEIVSPRDSASGLPTGKRQHKPLTILKPIDKSTPLLFQALTTNEQIASIEFEVYQPAGKGKVKITRTGKLERAKIASITKPKDPKYAEYEEIAFTFDKISWAKRAPRIQGVDDWAQ